MPAGRNIVEIEDSKPEPMRWTILVDAGLPPGRAANAAAVIALTIGKRHPELAGTDLIDASNQVHPGLIPIGIAILSAPAEELAGLRAMALKIGADVVDFPSQGQETTDYSEFRERVREVPTEQLIYVGVGVYGTRKSVGRIVGRYPLLK